MKLSMANDVMRGHKVGLRLLILFHWSYALKYHYLSIMGDSIELEVYTKNMTLEEFNKIGMALWEYGKRRDKIFKTGGIIN